MYPAESIDKDRATPQEERIRGRGTICWIFAKLDLKKKVRE